MKKSLLVLAIGVFMTMNCVQAEDNIAVVDLQKIVSGSNQVKQLKQEHAKKMEELNKIIVNARGEISNETDSAKILQLEEKYTKEFNTKKTALENDYNSRLSNIEKILKKRLQKRRKQKIMTMFLQKVSYSMAVKISQAKLKLNKTAVC